MTQLSPGETQPTLGLRERKKAKTRAAIQRHALRLFREQGYAATTVEQIAAAVEISPSTFFRYFPTKEDVVLYDAVDPVLFAAFFAQPANLTPIQAMRGAIRTVFEQLPEGDLSNEWERTLLVLSEPDLRMRVLDQTVQTIEQLAELVGRRVGRRPDDLAVRTFVGAVIGAMLATLDIRAVHSMADFLERMDAGLALLEAGLPL
jgi:AcrR family transcriptional regulator